MGLQARRLTRVGLFILALCVSCSKSGEEACGEESSDFSTVRVSEVTSTSFKVTGSVTPPPCERLTESNFGAGIILSDMPDPTLGDLHNEVGRIREDGWNGSRLRLDATIEGLMPATTYYMRPYVTINFSRHELGPEFVITTLP